MAPACAAVGRTGPLKAHVVLTLSERCKHTPCLCMPLCCRQVPEPMFEGNYESGNLACFVGDSLPAVVTASQGWSWRNDGTAEKPKWGYSTSTVGAVLQLKLDTRMTAAAAAQPGSSTPSTQPADTQDSRRAGTSQAAPDQHSSSGDGQAGSTDDAGRQQGQPAVPSMQPEEPAPALRLEQGAQPASGPGGRHLRETAATRLLKVAASDSAPTSDSAPQQGSAAQQRAHHQLQQAIDHSSEWWEAQQAQEEQQERSKLQESNRGWQAGDILVWVGYTKTWRGAGRAVMSCGGGCSCKNITVDGHHR